MRYRGWVIGALLAVAATTSALARDMTPRQVVDAYLAAWNAHDADAAAALMADDVTYLDITVGEPQKGRDAARDKVIKMFVTAAPDVTYKMKGEPIESANGVAFEWTFAGTNTGAWGPDTPATGKPFSFNGVTFMRVENGKIVYQGDYYDGLGFQKQLGWIRLAIPAISEKVTGTRLRGLPIFHSFLVEMMFNLLPKRPEFVDYVARLETRPALQRATALDQEFAAA